MPRDEATVDRIFAGNLDDLPPLSSKVRLLSSFQIEISEDGFDPIVCLWNIFNSLNFCFVSFQKIWRFLEGQVVIYLIIGDQTLQMKIKQIIPSSFHTKAQSLLSRKLRLFELCQVPDCQVQFLSSFLFKSYLSKNCECLSISIWFLNVIFKK